MREAHYVRSLTDVPTSNAMRVYGSDSDLQKSASFRILYQTAS